MNILKYPTMLSVEDYFSNTVSKDSITYNAGWCYGNAGIVTDMRADLELIMNDLKKAEN